MSKLSISPNLMFQFSATVHLATAKVERTKAWELDQKFELPSFSNWLPPTGDNESIKIMLAWSKAGMFLQAQFEFGDHAIGGESCNFRFWIDSRGAVANKRLTKFCHLLEYDIDWRLQRVRESIVYGKSASLTEIVDNSQKPSSQTRIEFEGDSGKLKSFIPAESLHGFQPEEFPQISYFFDYGHGSAARLNAGTDSRIRYDIDPSVWIIARLV